MWNVMVYMSGDNDLGDEMVWGLQDMREAAQSPQFRDSVRLVAQYDPSGGYPRLYDFTRRGAGPRLRDYEVQPRLSPQALANRHADTFARETLRNVAAPQPNVRSQVIQHYRGLATTAAAATATALRQEFQKVGFQPVRNIQQNLESWLKEHTRLMVDDISVRAQLQSFVVEQVGLLDPGDRYMIVLSGHGSGSAGDFLSAQDPRSALTIRGMETFLRLVRIALRHRPGGGINRRTWWEDADWGRELRDEDRRVDILGLDSCLASMAELCYEVRGHVDFLLGTESFVSNLGWPYRRLLEPLSQGLPPEQVAGEFVRGYGAFYEDYEEAGASSDLVGIRLDRMSDVKDSVRALSRSMREKLLHDGAPCLGDLDEIDELDPFQEPTERNAIDNAAGGAAALQAARQLRNALILAHWYAQSYRPENYADLWDFCDQLRRFLQGNQFEAVLDGARRVQDAVQAAAPYMITIGPASQHSHGLAVYFPWDAARYSDDYQKLAFAGDAEWDQFLRLYLRVTRRARRHQAAHRQVQNGVLQATGDVIRHGIDVDPLDADAPSWRYPKHGTRAFPGHGTRDFPESGTRDFPESGTRDFPESGTRYGKFRCVGAKNPPDGFYRHQALAGSGN